MTEFVMKRKLKLDLLIFWSKVSLLVTLYFSFLSKHDIKLS